MAVFSHSLNKLKFNSYIIKINNHLKKYWFSAQAPVGGYIYSKQAVPSG